MAFNKSNWSRTVASDKARVYLPAAIPVGNITNGNNGTTIFTLTVPFEFQGPGQVFVTIPAGQASLPNGISLDQAQLLAPASGSYAAGNHPRVSILVNNGALANANVNVTTAVDLLAVQY
jgi:hypothetical protein